MSDDLEKKLLAGAAYRIFFDELKKHVDATRAVFDSELVEDALKEAMGRYHTIRGGAGFFKFTVISELAGKLECALQEATAEKITPRLEELKGLNSALAQEAEKLPPPAAPAAS